MNKIAITVAAAAALLPILPPAAAGASTGEAATGSFTSTVGVTQVDHSGGNTTFYGPELQRLTGTLNGTRVASGVMVVHADGSFEARDKGVFTGTVDGRWGSVEIDGVSKGVGTFGAGQLIIGQGTGALAGLHGQGSFEPHFTSFTTATGSYSVDIHFEP